MSYSSAFAKGVRPDPYINLVDWNNEHRYIADESGPEGGRYRTSRTPYVEEILMELSPQRSTQEVVFVKPTQIGATEIGNCFLFATAKRYPGPSLMAFPTGEMAKKHSKKKIRPAIDAMRIMDDVITKTDRKDSGNTLLLKEFPGGSWTFTGSNSPVAARSDSVRYLIRDDYDGFIHDAGDEGFIGDLLLNRTDAYGVRKKIYTNSTPTTKDASHIESEWDESSQGLYNVPCPHCGEIQFLEFGGKDWKHGIKFTKDTDGFVDQVWYVCKKCHKRIEEYQKTDMMARGVYVHKYPDREKRGFKINSLYSPLGWFSWKSFVAEFLTAARKLKRGDDRAMKKWTNTRKAELWEADGEQPEWNKLFTRAEPYRVLTVPEGGYLVTAGVDTHDNRLDIQIKAYGPGEESWVVFWGSLWGDPDQADVWKQLDEMLYRTYKHSSGVELPIITMAIDTGGHRAQAVYKYARSRAPKVIACKGSSSKGRPIIGKPSKQDIDVLGKKIKKGVDLWPVGTEIAKGMIYNRLKITEKGPGYCHFPLDIGEEYYLQLTAEKLVKRYVKGFPVHEWVNTRGANHALDCDVLCLVAAYRAGIQTINWPGLIEKIKGAPVKAAPAQSRPAVKPGQRPVKAAGGYQRPAWLNR